MCASNAKPEFYFQDSLLLFMPCSLYVGIVLQNQGLSRGWCVCVCIINAASRHMEFVNVPGTTLPIKNHGFRQFWAIILFPAALQFDYIELFFFFFYGSHSSCPNTWQALKITVLSPISLMSDVIEPEKFVCIGCIFIMSVFIFTSQIHSPRNSETTQLDTLILSLLIIMCDICFSVGRCCWYFGWGSSLW